MEADSKSIEIEPPVFVYNHKMIIQKMLEEISYLISSVPTEAVAFADSMRS